MADTNEVKALALSDEVVNKLVKSNSRRYYTLGWIDGFVSSQVLTVVGAGTALGLGLVGLSGLGIAMIAKEIKEG